VDADRQLVTDVLGHRPGAFERLVREYQGLCWHIIQRMVRHPEDTRELCQEAFLRIHRNLGQYRFEAPLKSWIGQVAYSVARRHLERKRIPLLEDDGDGGSLLEAVPDGYDLAASAETDEQSGVLHAAIESLPPLPRMLLTLHYLDEVPIADIAAMTGLPEGTIKSHLFRSRRQLRALLEPRLGVAA